MYDELYFYTLLHSGLRDAFSYCGECMSGLKSIRKGKATEYRIRDCFRAAGFESHRVPSSGNSQGFKGDLVVKVPLSRDLIIEVKARKAGFKEIYKLMSGPSADMGVVTKNGVYFTWYADYVIHCKYAHGHWNTSDPTYNNLKKLKGSCDVLVIKQDRCPPIYVRWLDECDR